MKAPKMAGDIPAFPWPDRFTYQLRKSTSDASFTGEKKGEASDAIGPSPASAMAEEILNFGW
jgi:hypothetical protein